MSLQLFANLNLIELYNLDAPSQSLWYVSSSDRAGKCRANQSVVQPIWIWHNFITSGLSHAGLNAVFAA